MVTGSSGGPETARRSGPRCLSSAPLLRLLLLLSSSLTPRENPFVVPMPSSPSTIDKPAIEAIAEPVCRAHGVELVDVQWATDRGGAVLRVLIDRERPDVAPGEPGSGVSVEDCQHVSRDLSVALDVHDRIVPSGRYRLEVSSPGLDRPLVKRRDFERFAGREVRVQTRAPIAGAGERKKVQGVLKGLVEGELVQIEEGAQRWEIRFDDILKANVVYRF
jgi:ribosome maturation factor RimP